MHPVPSKGIGDVRGCDSESYSGGDRHLPPRIHGLGSGRRQLRQPGGQLRESRRRLCICLLIEIIVTAIFAFVISGVATDKRSTAGGAIGTLTYNFIQKSDTEIPTEIGESHR